MNFLRRVPDAALLCIAAHAGAAGLALLREADPSVRGTLTRDVLRAAAAAEGMGLTQQLQSAMGLLRQLVTGFEGFQGEPAHGDAGGFEHDVFAHPDRAGVTVAASVGCDPVTPLLMVEERRTASWSPPTASTVEPPAVWVVGAQSWMGDWPTDDTNDIHVVARLKVLRDAPGLPRDVAWRHGEVPSSLTLLDMRLDYAMRARAVWAVTPSYDRDSVHAGRLHAALLGLMRANGDVLNLLPLADSLFPHAV